MKQMFVKDLRDYLDSRNISPEKFAVNVQLSHMTIRRWLKKPDKTKISKKYYSNIGPILNDQAASSNPPISPELLGLAGIKSLNVESMMDEIHKSGKDFTDFKALNRNLITKLKIPRLDKIFPNYCRRLYSAARSSKTPPHAKAIAIGALLYFINPIDIIPDHIPVIGYLDDLAVLSLALNYLSEYV